jgi:hypothetical protein
MSQEFETLGLTPSFGFGDRIGSATPGHVAAMKRQGAGMAPIFAQQSIREMQRTRRSAREVIEDVVRGAGAWGGPMGADADHLKTAEDVELTTAAGYTFFTLDPSDRVDQQADRYDEEALRRRFALSRDHAPWYDSYVGRTVRLRDESEIELSEETCMRAAVKYGAAIALALELGARIRKLHEAKGVAFELELSVDETEEPTTGAEHYIIADRFFSEGMPLISLAPRFVGAFEKGVDYKGEVAALERSLAQHAAVSRTLGPYKLSLHSGSDKLSAYGPLARATEGCFHVKTAGTSYMEALRVVAAHDPALFRRIVAFARSRYDTDRATYHLSARLEDTPDPGTAADGELEREYLERWSEVPDGAGFTRPGRQILHCTFGSVLTDGVLGSLVRACLDAHPETYSEYLDEHFGRHLSALRVI